MTGIILIFLSIGITGTIATIANYKNNDKALIKYGGITFILFIFLLLNLVCKIL